jgi:hypothetical protein
MPMPAPLFSHLLVRLSRPLVVVPLLAASFVAGCPQDPPPPVVIDASLKLDAQRARVTIGGSVDVTFESKAKGGAGDDGVVNFEVRTIEGDTGDATIGADEGSALSRTFDVTPTGGEGGLVLRCVAAGKVLLHAESTGTNETAEAEFECVQATNFFYSIAASIDVACTRLQADGVSSCPVTLTVSRQLIGSTDAPVPASDETVDVEVTEVSDVEILDGVRGVSVDGIPAVLASGPNSVPEERLAGLQTDAEGKVTFLVVSPRFGVSETVAISASAQGIEKALTAFVIAPFENQSNLLVTASKTELESGRTSTLAITANRTDGAPAASERVTLTSVSPTPAVFSAGPGVTVVDGVATVTLDDAGTGSVVVTAPDVVGRGVAVPVQATYDTGVDANVVPPLVTTLTLSVSERGSVIGNADFTATTMRSDEPDATPVRFFVTAESGEEPFGDVAVNVSIAPDSQALIRFGGDRGGTDAVRRSLASLSAAAAGQLGRAEFAIVPVSPIARGTATVNVQMTQSGNTIFQASRTITVARDPILQSVVFVSAVPPVIGVRGGTQPSTASVTFRLVDDAGAPLSGVPVRFVTNATADRGVSVEQSDISAADGIVQTTLSAGSIAGPVTVVATALPANGLPITVESASIAVVGGLPTFLNSAFSCEQRSGASIETTCAAQLVDRFTNRIGANTQVQFRSEGGSITPSAATNDDGVAQGTFSSNNSPGKPNADVASWSYGAPVRLNDPTALAGFGGAAACTDATTATGCNLIALCDDPDTADLCPLPGRQSEPDLLPITGAQLEVDETRRCDVDLDSDPRACGFPVGCLNGTGNDCNVNMGCFDFSSLTFCPQSGLATIIASARGEESFLDGNGNGILDFIDVNNNGRHETGEPIGVPCRFQRSGSLQGDPNCVLSEIVRDEGPCPQPGQPGFSGDLDAACKDGVRQVDDFIDSPEPFLDKNGSCSRDNFLYARAANGMSLSEAYAASDLFSDVDGSATFGFDENRDNVVDQTNGTWDRDTELFLETHVLEVGAPRLLFGEACSPRLGQHSCNEPTSPDAVSPCVELADGTTGIAPGCNPSLKPSHSSGDSGDYLYAWVDGNGNCPTTNFSALTKVEAIGAGAASAQERTLDEAVCGFSSELDPDRPWCKVQPVLGAPALSVSIVFDCLANDDRESEATKLSFELLDTELPAKEEFALLIDPTTCNPPAP